MAANASKKKEEVEQLRNWCLTIVRFIGERGASDLFRELENAINKGAERGSLRGLKIVAGDLREMAGGLNAQDQEKLDAIMLERFGRGLREENRMFQREVARILKRGAIKDPDEYRLLVARADEIHADDSKRGEFDRINELFAAFDAQGKTENDFEDA